jgi:HlyD family secretion protein
MQTRSKLGLAGGALALAALLAWAFAPRPVPVETALLAAGRFESSVEEDGRTRVVDRYLVSAPLAGLWLRPSLREGDGVAVGALLGRILPAASPLIDARSQAELGSRVAAAAAMLRAAGSRFELARVGSAQARRELARSEQLAQQGFVGAAKLETDQLNLQAATQEQAAAAAELQVAQSGLAQARAALGLVNQGSGKAFELRSPVAGQVLRLQQASEAVVNLGMPLLEIGDISRLELVAELLTSDALQASPGSKVVIDRWGGAQKLEGLVSRVEPGAFTKISALGVEEQRVRVIVQLTSPAAQRLQLGDGFRVALKIITRSQENALLVPVSAVFPLPGGTAGQRGVFLLEGGRARLTEVELEARNSQVAWVRKGLLAGAQVIIYPPSGVTDGVRVVERKV